MTEVTPAGRPNAEARRQQIIDAASACVRRAGFHGASMAEIAQAASLSVGQIYRYFDNKEAIIAAIVARDVAEMRDKFSELQNSGQPLLEAIISNCSQAVDDYYDPERSALILEVVAEAARNPRVAAIVQAADSEERAFGHDIIRQILPANCSETELAARGEVLSMIFDGMAVRGVNNPSGDRAAISKILSAVMRHLLTELPCEPGGPTIPKS